MEGFLFTLLSVALLPVAFAVALAIALASIGKSLGLRKFYVGILLKVFEALKHKVHTHENDEEEESGEDEVTENENEDASGEEVEIESDSKEADDPQSSTNVIQKDFSLSASKGVKRPSWDTIESYKKDFELSDVCYFAKFGMEAIIEDDVTKRFSAAELPSWNLLTRTQKHHQFMSVRLTALYFAGCFIRYCILLPFRFSILVMGLSLMTVGLSLVGCMQEGKWKTLINRQISLMGFRVLARAFSAVITFHNRENMSSHGICVANHTSPIDVIIMSTDNTYAMIGQTHGGFLGMLQRALGRATSHIWFERSEMKDRNLVAKRLKDHLQDKKKLPILIFPEGTCINNTSVMMFKKGSFEVSSTVYPAAIKYDPLFGDAFWNSSKEGFAQHLISIMSSWALVVDVWYMSPMEQKPNEDAVSFANRVKSEIARQGGMVDLEWDGALKRTAAKDSWKGATQKQYSNILKVD